MDSRAYQPFLGQSQQFQSYAQYVVRPGYEQPLAPQQYTAGALQMSVRHETSHNVPFVDYQQLMQPLPTTQVHVPERSANIDFSQIQRKAPKAGRTK